MLIALLCCSVVKRSVSEKRKCVATYSGDPCVLNVAKLPGRHTHRCCSNSKLRME